MNSHSGSSNWTSPGANIKNQLEPWNCLPLGASLGGPERHLQETRNPTWALCFQLYCGTKTFNCWEKGKNPVLLRIWVKGHCSWECVSVWLGHPILWAVSLINSMRVTSVFSRSSSHPSARLLAYSPSHQTLGSHPGYRNLSGSWRYRRENYGPRGSTDGRKPLKMKTWAGSRMKGGKSKNRTRNNPGVRRMNFLLNVTSM